MGELEPLRDLDPHEIGLVIEVVAATQALADTICSFARSTLLHFGYPGRQSTARKSRVSVFTVRYLAWGRL